MTSQQITLFGDENSKNRKLRRFLIFRSPDAKSYLCVCAARDNNHALKIARQLFALGRSAVAILERPF
jgi:hypothetical protein